jgi:hypothetical protein
MQTMIDWRYRFGSEDAANYRIELGMFTLASKADAPRWDATALVQEFKHCTENPENSIGPFVEGSPGSDR